MSSEVVFNDESAEPDMPPPIDGSSDEQLVEGETEGDARRSSSIQKLRPKDKRQATPRDAKPLVELRTNETLAVKEWLESLSPQGAIKVKVTRTGEPMWKGLRVGGVLTTYDRMIDEEWIRDRHGGGDYHLEVKIPNPPPQGGWRIAGHRDIHIAGDPRTDDVFRNQGDEKATPVAGAQASTAIVDRALGSLERQLERAQQQGTTHGMDPAMIHAMMAPLQAQVMQLGQMLRDSHAQLAAAQQVKPVERDEFREKMLSAMIDGDSARLTSLRTQQESELRQLKQSAVDNETRLYDRFERDKQQLIMSHERELNALRSAYDMKVASQETSHSTGRTLMDGEIRRLQADLTEAKSELAALRIKKDKTILEQASEFAAIKEAIGEITGDEAKGKSGWEKLAEVAGNLPVVQSAIAKMGGIGEPAPTPPQPAPPRPRLLTGPDGNLYRQNPDGQMQLVRRRAQARQESGASTPIEIPATTIKIAVEFLEAGFRNGHEPADVATSVRSMIPSEVLAAIRERGVDGFLTDVAKLEGTSPLASQAGRNWARKVGKSLVGE